MKKTVLVDLDGVLNDYNGNFDPIKIPPPKIGVKEFLSELSESYRVVVFTARSKETTVAWLRENCLFQFISEVTNIKIPAFIILDDRCVKFEGNFENAMNDIKFFTPYWKGAEKTYSV